ncbi:retrovirus-related pol polyprotein from transposon TNT 1-94 [Tanacetum coccineum]
MTPTTPNSGLVPNPPPSVSFVSPSRDEWDLMFQPVFDEFFTPPANAPSPSTSQTTLQSQSQTIPLSVEEESHDLEAAHMSNNSYFGIPIPETVSEESSSSDVIPTTMHLDALILEHLSKWTKDNPLEAVRIFLAFAAHVNMIVYQMDVKTTFLNGILHEEAPRAWYDLLSSFLLSQGFSKGTVDPTLFISRKGKDILLVQIYVDDIIFASTTTELCDKFSKIMCSKFKMSMMGKISSFLGLQISQSPRGIFLNQSKYALESLKKYIMESCDPVDTPMVKKSKLDEDTQGKAVDPTHYHDMVDPLMYLTSSRPDLKSVGYGVSMYWIRRIHVLDTAYWGFLGVYTTFDIFQNIILIPYLEYGVLSPLDMAY